MNTMWHLPFTILSILSQKIGIQQIETKNAQKLKTKFYY